MLNKEEKKVIEELSLKSITSSSLETKDYPSMICFKKDVITVLNLITKLQKENEHWKNGFERELESNRENTCELLKQDLVIREKDEQIDLMAEYIIELIEFNNPNEVRELEEVKQYFQNLAKKGE